MKPISWSDFEKVDMRVGVVVDAGEFPEANRPAYRLSSSAPAPRSPTVTVPKI